MKKTILLAILFCATQFLHSQAGKSSAGDQATGIGGTINYTVGQLFYANLTAIDGTTVSEGVQQQYEKRTYIFNNTWLPSNPSGLSFAEDEIQVIAGDVTISSSNTYFDTLTINPGASVTVSNGAAISASSATILNSTSNTFSSLIFSFNG